MKPEDFRVSTQRPFTGEEYLKSLQDGREIYIYGERVKDVTTHPAFRNAAASVAQLYDALHKPEMQDSLCWNTDTGSGGYTHKFFRVAKSADDLRQQTVRPLGSVVILRVEREVCVQHAHERHVFKIQPLGNHLRAKKNGDILFFKFAQQRFMSA